MFVLARAQEVHVWVTLIVMLDCIVDQDFIVFLSFLMDLAAPMTISVRITWLVTGLFLRMESVLHTFRYLLGDGLEFARICSLKEFRTCVRLELAF